MHVLKLTPYFVLCCSFSGGEIVSTFDMPDSVKLGRCDLIEEVMIGEDRLIKFSGEWCCINY
jgi:hypothetical protein